MKKFSGLSLAFFISFLVPLLPFLIHGAPFISDCWMHMKIAFDAISSGTLPLKYNDPSLTYNAQWPLINALFTFIILICGFNVLYVSQFVPLLAGLSAIPLYLVVKGISKDVKVSIFATLLYSLEGFHVSFASSVMKETATLYILMTFIFVYFWFFSGRTNWKHLMVLLFLSCGLLLGHHYLSLFTLVFVCFAACLSAWSSLQPREHDKTLSWLVLSALIFIFVFALRAIFLWEGFITIYDIAYIFVPLMFSSFIITLWFSRCCTRKSRVSRIPKFALFLVLIAFILGYFAVSGRVYFVISPPSRSALLFIPGYFLIGLLSVLGFSKASGCNFEMIYVRTYFSSFVCVILSSFLWGFDEIGIWLIVKASHHFAPAMTLASTILLVNVSKRIRKVSCLLLILGTIVSFGAGIRCVIFKDPELGGIAAYYGGEIFEAESLSRFMDGSTRIYGGAQSRTLLRFYNVSNVSSLPLLSFNPGFYVVLRSNWEGGFFVGGGYQWVSGELVLNELNVDNCGIVFSGNYVQVFWKFQ